MYVVFLLNFILFSWIVLAIPLESHSKGLKVAFFSESGKRHTQDRLEGS